MARRRGVLRWVVTLAVIALAGGAGWWAGRITLMPEETEEESGVTTVIATVSEATVGRVFNLNVTVRQPLTLFASNVLAGVVTDVSNEGEMRQGSQVYAVNDVPVRVVEGSFPFFRELSEGAKGEDVRQVQAMLSDLGFWTARDGDWGPRTTAAVERWQKATGREETGVIGFGELVAVPALPGTISLGESIVIGHTVNGGEDGVLATVGDPTFVLNVTHEQANNIPTGASIEVTFEDLVWDAVLTGEEVPQEGEEQYGGGLSLALEAAGGGLVCGTECHRLPAAESTSLASRIQVVPHVTGPAVPAAALRTDATGDTFVEAPDGTRVPVTVLGSGDGLAVVEGVDLGDEVLVIEGG